MHVWLLNDIHAEHAASAEGKDESYTRIDDYLLSRMLSPPSDSRASQAAQLSPLKFDKHGTGITACY